MVQDLVEMEVGCLQVTCGGDAVVTGAGQGVSRITTLIVPIVSTFASQTWQSVGTQISLLDERLKSKNKRIRDGSFSNQIVPLSVETVPGKSSEEFHDFNRRSQVRFSTSSSAVYSPQQDVRSE